MAFNKVLIANRGEIAVRVARGAKAMGYGTVAVFSDADADALHVRVADGAVRIGPAPVGESYLSIENIVAAAKAAGADAVHPGYGFLAENAAFAEACEKAGLVFIGPSPDAIALMGDKARAKARMIEAKVPTVPGHEGDEQGEAALKKAAKTVGYPLMIKAAAGGGGRGMRVVEDEAGFKDALKSAKSEAKGAFGDDRVLLERRVVDARHVEIQVIADAHGAVLHLGERDCSVQRRHQKVIEEAPSPAVDETLRAAMGDAACAAARAIGYRGAGTVEFLLDRDGAFYFLEMNTRLQVEHPVTELVTGHDLVALQLLVAAGEKLPLSQDEVAITGHAMEARLYAEDPAAGFLPAAGRIAAWSPPAGDHVRVDHGVLAGQEVTPFYDPMLAKVIVWGETRTIARRRLIGALKETVLAGLPTNLAFLLDVLGHETFAGGEATTDFVDNEYDAAALAAPPPEPATVALACLLLAGFDGPEIWGRRAVAQIPMTLEISGERREATLEFSEDGRHAVTAEGKSVHIRVLERDGDRVRYEADGVTGSAIAVLDGTTAHIVSGGVTTSVREIPAFGGAAGADDGDGAVRAPLTGTVIAAPLEPGAEVSSGDLLFVLEAMKMEHELRAPFDGRVAERRAGVGDQVQVDHLMMVLEEK